MAVLKTAAGRHIAYEKTEGAAPGVVFLGGLRSDMAGTKAVHLETWARARGRAFLRFDYSGHGESGGVFTEGCIGDWAEDAGAVINGVTEGPQVLVGSSMGGWIACLLARDARVKLAGLVTVAAAPDFTEDGFWAGFSEAERARLMAAGLVEVPSDYGDPYPITRRLIEDGRRHLVLRSPLPLAVPVRLLQGAADAEVSVATALRLFEHLEAEDLALEIVKRADHRFSEPAELARIERAVSEVLAKWRG